MISVETQINAPIDTVWECWTNPEHITKWNFAFDFEYFMVTKENWIWSLVLAFYITIAATQSPNSGLAVWSSMFPLFSPIVMPSRLPFDPPWWQVVSSILLLIGACIALVWLSGRIYRVGILLYGKKVSLLEMGRWIFRK